MISTLKRCLIFLALFVFSPVSANSNGDSGSAAFLVVVMIMIFLFIMVCRCIEEANESEPTLEDYSATQRVTPVHVIPVRVSPGRVDGFRNFNGYGNVPFQSGQQPSASQANASGYTNQAYVANTPTQKEPDYNQPPPPYDLIEFNENAKKFGQNVQRY